MPEILFFTRRKRLACFSARCNVEPKERAAFKAAATQRSKPERFRSNGERDEESFLAWARESYACIIFNLHTVHPLDGIKHSAEAFRRLINLASERRGTHYLTHHKFASRRQLEACYPEFPEFLALKQKFDPQEIFQSEWYRHYRNAPI
jgi:FAD/FMN-containing dehydrogenase